MKKQTLFLPPKRVAAVHDLSCLGRCALTVVMPTLSVMGYQVVPLPTALLSTHTGGYSDLHFRDLSEDLPEIFSHFSRLGTRFRAIYTGFLGSAEQIGKVKKFIADFSSLPDESGEKPLVLIDPVMGDDGELYSTYTEELADGIRELSLFADLLTPNLTEAAYLAKMPYRDTSRLPVDEAKDYVKTVLSSIDATRGKPCAVVITGIPFSDGSVGNFGHDENGVPVDVSHPRCPVSYPGAGDLFASVLLGKVLEKRRFSEAVAFAAEFVRTVSEKSALVDSETRAGLSLEPELYRLCPKK